MTLMIIFSNAVNAYAVTGIYIGRGNVSSPNGVIDYDVRAHVYYFSNTSSSLDVHSLVQYIDNYGSYNVNEVVFKVHEGDFSKFTDIDYFIEPITAGNYRRIEADWVGICYSKGYNTLYSKNGDDVAALTSIFAGFDSFFLGGWDVYWFPYSRVAYFTD